MIGNESRTLSQVEQNYLAPERKSLVLAWTIQILRPYTENTSFKLRTDQNALKWMLTTNDPNGTLMRWRLP